MKMLIVFLLFCAMMAALPEAEAGNGTMNELIAPLIQDAEGLMSKAIRKCPCGWIEFRGRCFYYEPTGASWSEAERNCQSMGANLASVHSTEEFKLIERMIFLHTHWNPPTWLGGSDITTEGNWRWQDGTPFDFTKWCPGEPNDLTNQDCLQIQIADPRCFDDMWCHRHLPSVCVRSL